MDPASKSCEVEVRVTPRSSANRIQVESGRIKVWVTAPPVDGQANRAVCDLMARTLGLPKSSLEVVSGHTSRDKRCRVLGLNSEEVMARLGGSALF